MTSHLAVHHRQSGREYVMSKQKHSRGKTTTTATATAKVTATTKLYFMQNKYIPGFIKRVPEPGRTISPDPDFRPSPGPLFVEDLTARAVRTQPPASGLLAGIKLNSLVSNLEGACQIEILQFRQEGGGGGGGGLSSRLG